MQKKKKDVKNNILEISDNVSVSSKIDNRNKIWILILSLLLCEGTMLTFISAYNIPVYTLAIILATFIVCVSMVVLEMHCSKSHLVIYPILFLAIVPLIFFRRNLYLGLCVIKHAIIARINSTEIYSLEVNSIGGITNQRGHVTLVILLVCILEVYLVNLAVLKLKNFLLLVLVIFPFAFMGLICRITAKSWMFYLLVVGLFAAVSVCSVSSRGLNGDNKRSKLLVEGKEIKVLIIFIGIIVLFLNILAPENKYKQPKWFSKAYKAINGFLLECFDSDDTNRMSMMSTGGIAFGDLTNSGNISFSGKDDLAIYINKFDEVKKLYLKGYVATDYENGKWVNHDDDYYSGYISDDFYYLQTLSSQLIKDNVYNSVLSEIMYNTKEIEIKYINANRTIIYQPYFNKGIEGFGYTNDLMIRNKEDVDSYSFTYIDYFSQNMLNCLSNCNIDPNGIYYDNTELNKTENKYISYVYELYTKVPNDFSEMESECNNYMSAVDREHADVNKIISDVRQYFKDNYSYSINPGSAPIGEDPVKYFLEKMDRGYCMHFASAGTLIFRAMGIPARYVEGYVISNNNDVTPYYVKDSQGIERKQINISDKFAHAWVEIYINGVGWYPVELTPGYNNEIVGSTSSSDSTTESTNATSTQEITTEQNTSEKTTNTESSQGNTSNNETSKKSAINKKELAKVISTTMILACIIIVILGYRILIVAIRRKKLNLANDKKAYQNIYRYNQKVLAYVNLSKTISENYEDYFNRIKDANMISDEMADELSVYMLEGLFSNSFDNTMEYRETSLKLAKKIYKKLGAIKRIRFRYIDCLLL